MAQITLYLDDETQRLVAQAAKAAHLSKSTWVAGVIQRSLASEWPQDIRRLSGAWKDFPSLEELRAEGVGDLPREEL